MDMEKIGKFIAACRKEKGFTQGQLAEQLGVTYKAVSKWENGRNLPDPSLYKPLCAAHGITLTEFFNGEYIAKEEMIPKSDDVICQIAESSRESRIMQAIAYDVMVAGIAVIFLPIAGQFGNYAAIATAAAGLGLFLLGIAMRVTIWSRSQNKKITNSGMGICSGLTVLFVALKLTGYIDWPWIWVVAPLWIGAGSVVLFLVLILIGFSIAKKIKESRS